MKNHLPKNKTYFIALFMLGLGIFFGWLFFSSPTTEEHVQHAPPDTPAKARIWTCSMHPQIRQSQPGNCPICGMELIPLEEEHQQPHDTAAINMSPTAMQLANVQTTIITSGKLQKSIELNGKVQIDERSLFTQAAHVAGRIEKLYVNFVGEYVQAGQTLALVYSSELVSAQQELLEAKKLAASQPHIYQAAKEKLSNWKITDAQIEEMLTADKAIELFPIVAHVSGYITKRFVNLGDHAMQGQAIYEIADLSTVWVLFDVYESDLTWIKTHQYIDFSVASLPGKSFRATISYIDPRIDPMTRIAKARVNMPNPHLQLKPEMFVSGRVYATLHKASSTILVPKSAVLWSGKKSIVYVKQEDETGVYFRAREVTIAANLGEGFAIEKGLTLGEEIATNGTFSIDAAAQLAGKPSMMNPH